MGFIPNEMDLSMIAISDRKSILYWFVHFNIILILFDIHFERLTSNVMFSI